MELAHTRTSGGWWPYIVPYLAFLLVVELSAYLPVGFGLPVLLLKPIIPAVLLVLFSSRGAYMELRGSNLPDLRTLTDVGVGILSGCLWMAPYLLFPALRPNPSFDFDPYMAGPDLVGWVLVLRFVGFALVTPVFEELFIRSFVMRYAEAMRKHVDFRNVSIAHYSMPSFLATVVVFTITHAPWEYWAAVPWIVLTNLYFYWRRSLRGLITVHGCANAWIFSFVVFNVDWSQVPGTPPSLWFLL